VAKKQSLNRPAGGGGGSRSTLYIILALIVLAGVYGLAFVGADGSSGLQNPAAPAHPVPAHKPAPTTAK
jgi:hypothetical protein